jgi:putative tryptophan/tyrosine transport system substrate-binding protein
MFDMRRRNFITLLGGAAAAWPLAARGQQPAMPVIGYIDAGSPEPAAQLLSAFRGGLGETGFVEGRNVAIEFRWAHNINERLPELAADLVRRRVAVIVAPQSTAAVMEAKAATRTIPIVFGTGADPVQAGLVTSLNRPGGNITGITFMNVDITAKRLGLLRELLPNATRFALLINPKNSVIAETSARDAATAASAMGREVEIVKASTNREIDAAFSVLKQKRVDALLVAPDTLMANRRVQIATLAVRDALPLIATQREFAEAGGLMSYGTNFMETYRQTGIYTGRILKGENPADLPVLRAAKFEFVINLQTARTIGLEIPPTLLALADEVIE